MSVTSRFILTVPLLALGGLVSAELPQNSDEKHMGVATCAASQCHGYAVPGSGSNVLQNEYVTWTQDDPHGTAYETLNLPESLAIARRLGLDLARTADICLDCHTDNVSEDRRGERFQISDGIGCEACHGGAENWLSTHYNVPEVTHADSVAAGLYPTEDTAARAALCLSCHLGTRDKFATHRIMAAGHPRLAFELDTFTELWRTAGRQPHYRIDDDYVGRKGTASHISDWAWGVIAEARQRLALISDPGFRDNGMFPELGLYDCHACHRSMKTVQWRPLARHGGAGPGVPFLTDGTFVMSLALARAIAPADADALEAALADLHASGSGSPGDVDAAAEGLDGVLARVEAGLSPARLQNREGQILAEVLRLGAEENYLDYVSAEQAFMAVQMLVIELDDPDLEAELDRLAGSLDDDERYRPDLFARLLQIFSGAE